MENARQAEDFKPTECDVGSKRWHRVGIAAFGALAGRSAVSLGSPVPAIAQGNIDAGKTPGANVSRTPAQRLSSQAAGAQARQRGVPARALHHQRAGGGRHGELSRGSAGGGRPAGGQAAAQADLWRTEQGARPRRRRRRRNSRLDGPAAGAAATAAASAEGKAGSRGRRSRIGRASVQAEAAAASRSQRGPAGRAQRSSRSRSRRRS